MVTRKTWIIAAAFAAALIGTVLIIGSAVNSYKEWRFAQRQQQYEQQIAAGKAEAAAKAAEADRLKAEAATKDTQIATLEQEKSDLENQKEHTRVVYVNSRKPVDLRPVGAGVSDAELRHDAVAAGLTIRPAH